MSLSGVLKLKPLALVPVVLQYGSVELEKDLVPLFEVV